MAEFCKDCFKKYLLSSEDRERIKDENIIMFPTKDLCKDVERLSWQWIM